MRAAALLIFATIATTPWAQENQADAAEAIKFDYLFTIGSEHGVNPRRSFSGKWGRRAFGPITLSALNIPEAVTVDRNQRIWITDRGNAAVHMFDIAEGRYKVLRGVDTETPFVWPTGIDSDLHGRIYVSDAALGRIYVFDREGRFDRMLPARNRHTLFKQPLAIAVSSDLKSIFVADAQKHAVIVMNQEGETVRQLGHPGDLRNPTAIAIDSDRDRVYVLDSATRRVLAFTPGGGLIGTTAWPGVSNVSALAIDPDRHLFYVGDSVNEVVRVFTAEGKEVGAFGQSGSADGQLHGPGGLYVDSEERIYVIDRSGGKVLLFRPAAGVLPQLR